MLSVLGGDVQALLFLTVSGTEGKVKKNFTSFYSIFHRLTPFVTCRQGHFRTALILCSLFCEEPIDQFSGDADFSRDTR
jgi:hypothetical protein